MEVKGTAFVARRAFLIATFGEEPWLRFFDAWRINEPDFEAEIIPVAAIPVLSFLRFNDAVVDHFYEGDIQTHWRFGQASAEWALREGPYKSFFRSRATADFLRTAPSLWKAYYSSGSFHATWDPDESQVDAFIEVPTKHVHFELNVMGYLSRGLELTTGTSIAHQQIIKGFSRGDERIHYRFVLVPHDS